MSVNDDVLDAITGHSVDLVRVEAGLRKKVVKDLKALEKTVIKMLKSSGVAETIKQKVKEKRLRKLLGQTADTIATSYQNITKESKKDLGSIAGISAKQSVEAINGSLKASVASVGMSRSVLESISSNVLIEGAPSKEWWGRQSDQFQSEFSDVIRRGALLGKTTKEITDDFVGTQANNFKDGVAIRGRRRAEGLVRTSIQTVANEARQRTYAENEDIVKGIEWVSTLDSRTSNICKVLDGLVWDNDRNPVGHDKDYVGLTAHWNCRSTQVPVLKSWEELGAKKKFAEIPKSTRASMDGQVSESIKYEDWLKSKPESFQKEVLGAGKWELWKTGSLGFTDLIDQSGNELSLSELNRRHQIEDEKESLFGYDDFLKVTPFVESMIDSHHKVGWGAGGEDLTLKAMREAKGFNKLPLALSKEEFDSFEGRSIKMYGDSPILYRGVSDLKYVNDFKYKEHFAGLGVHGNGTYSAIKDMETALDYAQDDIKNVWAMKLKKDFNFITEDDLRAKQTKLYDVKDDIDWKIVFLGRELESEMLAYKKKNRPSHSDLSKLSDEAADKLIGRFDEAMVAVNRKYRNMITHEEKKAKGIEMLLDDEGRFATVLGYDGIYVERRGFMVIQNRDKVVVIK